MGRRGRGRGRKPAQPKRVAYQLIDKGTDIGKVMYRMLRELVQEHHAEIRDARIALAWNSAWKRDVDGRHTLGKCKKASDLDRELASFDFIVILHKDFWTNPTTTDAHRRALLDHELCHASVRVDRHGEPIVDERGRVVFRTRKHDLEEFACIAERHGCWKRDIESFAQALRRSPQGTLDLDVDEPKTPAAASQAAAH